LWAFTYKDEGASRIDRRPSRFRIEPIAPPIERETIVTTNELTRLVLDRLSSAVGQLPEGLRNELRAALDDVLTRLTLVNRQEFEVQTQLLARLSQRAEALERSLAEIDSTSQAART
jgi:BMFP domain-containing protein YqiC